MLVDDGFDVVAFEKEPTLGGVWAATRTSPGLLRCGKMAIIQGAAVVRSNECEWTFVEYGEGLTLKVNEN